MAPPKKKRSELGETAKKYRDNPELLKKKRETDKKINARPEQRKKRSELSTKRRKDKRNGKDIDGKDYDHATGRYTSPEANRGRKGEGARKKKK